MSHYLLSILIFTPVLAALMALFIPSDAKRTFRISTLVISAIQLILLVFVIAETRGAPFSAFQLVEKMTWFSIDLGSWGFS